MSEAEEPLLPKTQTFNRDEPQIENLIDQNPENMSRGFDNSGNFVEPPYIPSDDQANDYLLDHPQNPQESSLANHSPEKVKKPESPSKRISKRLKCVFSICSTIIIIVILRYLYTKPRVIRYCHWDFSFSQAYNSIDKTIFGSNIYSISEFIEVACLDSNSISHCPDLCDSVKNLNLSQGVMMLCIIIGSCSIIGNILNIIYMRFVREKILRRFVHGINCLGICVLAFGGFWYWFMANMMDNFAEPDKVNYDLNTYPEPYSFEILSVWMILVYLGLYLALHEFITFYSIK